MSQQYRRCLNSELFVISFPGSAGAGGLQPVCRFAHCCATCTDGRAGRWHLPSGLPVYPGQVLLLHLECSVLPLNYSAVAEAGFEPAHGVIALPLSYPAGWPGGGVEPPTHNKW